MPGGGGERARPPGGGAVDVVDLDGVSEVSGGAWAAAPGGGGSPPSQGGRAATQPPSSGTLWPASVPQHFGCAAALPACRSTYRFPAGDDAARGGGQSRGVQFTPEDLRCLEPGEFLNDTLLDMCLEWERAAAAEARARAGRRPLRAHVMGTFFYKKLTANPESDRRVKRGGTDPECSKAAEERALQQRLTPVERMHARVQGWTKGVDLFEQDYVIVPIHGGAHWSLAIICHPGAPSPGSPGATLPVDVEDVGPSPSACILHLDSLEGGHATSIITRTLRGYLGAEWQRKAKGEPGGTPRRFSCESMPAKRLRCPRQLNLCDCGLFVIENARRFLRDPPEVVESVHPLRNPKNVAFLFHGYAALEFDSEAFSPWDVAARRLDLYALLLRHLRDDPGVGLSDGARDMVLADCDRLQAGAKKVRSMRSILGVRKAREGAEGAGKPIDLTHTTAVKRGRATPFALTPSPTPSESEVLSDRLALVASEAPAQLERSPEPKLAPRPKEVVAFLNWGPDPARGAARVAPPPAGLQNLQRPGTQEEENTFKGGASREASPSAGSFKITAAAPAADEGRGLFVRPGGGLGNHL